MTLFANADHYDRFMGRFSEPLSVLFADWVGVIDGQSALDVGCGPGALTAQLVQRLGEAAVVAVDPSPSFVAAARMRLPGVDVREAAAERLPFEDDAFDLAVSQLVVHFMIDPVAGLAEMGRVTRPGGTVAACVWDIADGASPIAPFRRAVRDLDPTAYSEDARPGTREGHLAELLVSAGLAEVESGSLTVHVRFLTFAEWWEPYTLGVGPVGAYIVSLTDEGVSTLRGRCEELLGPGPFEVAGRAWCARGRTTFAALHDLPI